MQTIEAKTMKTELIPFGSEHFHLLLKWIDSDALNYLWGGPQFKYPLTEKQLHQHYSQQQALPFLFVVQDKPVGFIELYKMSSSQYRICRVFIHPEHQAKGYSIIMLKLVMKMAINRYKLNVFTLSVFAHNKAAIACYKKLGFEQKELIKGSRFFNGQAWDLIKMVKNV
ncbi:GNAT family N-acetyltransferase [Vibrio sp. MA40-2]|uniref:GNAT family N-acetyltransferase n=1 Tax=Vibrio sp. MA40-2 TaxID=3391828 RepID=UPI0039A664D4